MKNEDNRNIDELFREGLNQEKDTVTFVGNDWSKLGQRLDRHYKRKNTVAWLKPLAGIAALLLLFFSIWLLWPEKEKSLGPQRVVQPEGQKKKQGASAEKQTEGISKSDSSGLPAPGKPVRELPPGETTERKAVEREAAEKPVAAIDSAGATEPELEKKPKSEPETKHEQKPEPEQIRSEPYVPVPDNIFLPEREPRKLALSLLVAPSYNGVDNLNNLQSGGDVGVMFALCLTGRLSFSTGAVYAKKVYYTSYGSGDNAQKVNADCRVLDIPLNLNYTIIRKGSTSVSIGTGVSSYFMLKEDYRYENSDLPDIHLVNENQHWLGILNFHVNYEFKLDPRFSINVQPYMKIPMEDIGYARVRLQSLGLAIGASWNFNR